MQFLRSFYLLFAFILGGLVPVSMAHADKDVLLLLRGTAAHPFNQALLQGLFKTNSSLPTPYHVEVQYTANRFNSGYSPAWDDYYQALEVIRGDRDWDAIVVTWTTDLKFAQKYYSDTLIVNTSPGRYDEANNVLNLGQEFEVRITETLSWLSSAYPQLDDLHLIVGSSPVDGAGVETILKVARDLGYSSPDLLISRDPEDLKRQVSEMPETAAVIFLPLLTDHKGETLISVDVLRDLSAVSTVPILSPLGSHVQAGAIGGYVGLVDRYASEIIRVIRNNDNIEGLDPPPTASGWVFNQQQLERYGLTVPDLRPPQFTDAVLINQAPPLFSERGQAIFTTLVISALVLIMLTAYWSRNQRRIRRTVESLNRELEVTNRGLEETNTKLEDALYKAALEELKASTRTAQLQLAMRLASVTVFEVDFKTLKARRPDEAIWRPLIQQIAEGLEDSAQIEKIMQLNQSPYTDLDIECRQAHEGEPSERHNYRLTLSERTVNEEGREVFFLVRQEISEQRDAQKRLQAEAFERQNYQMQVARMAQHLSRFELENQKLSEIAKRADLDGLTGCLNREGWERLALQEFSRLKRRLDQTTSTLLMLDIDRFKQVNDNHGHLVGDKVLKQVVTIAQQQLRESDLLGRFGGEEFLILLPDTEEQEAEIFADRLRTAIRETKLENVPEVTVSIGLSQHQPSLVSLERWIELTDGALYLAKAKGRDRVQIA